MYISTVSEMREMDRKAISEYGIPEEILMENAALAVVSALTARIGPPASYGRTPIAVVCGPGNNGGDGLAIARKLSSDGYPVAVLLFTDPDSYKGAALLNYRIVQKSGVEITVVQKNPGRYIPKSGCIVDALLGTGLNRDVKGLYASCINAVNASAANVMSVDIPSGIGGDTGQAMGIAIQADWTVSFGLPKLGNLIYPGFTHCGELIVSHISFPRSLYQSPPSRFSVLSPAALPERDKAGHKGSFGDTLFVAGGSQYYGAPFLSASSFLKVGGGYARLAAPQSMVPALASMAPEVVYLPMTETTEGNTALCNADALLEAALEVDCVVIGPGLSREDETMELVRKLISKVRVPVLLDGDGLSAVADSIGVLNARKGKTVLTPHPGELARLTGLSAAEVVSSLAHVVRSLAESTGCTVVGKGAHTIVADPDGALWMNMSGNDGMATPGSGDVLSGVIPALFGAGLEFSDAAKCGVFMHGFAGDIAASEKGSSGLTASDISAALPTAVEGFRSEYAETTMNYYGAIKPG